MITEVILSLYCTLDRVSIVKYAWPDYLKVNEREGQYGASRKVHSLENKRQVYSQGDEEVECMDARDHATQSVLPATPGWLLCHFQNIYLFLLSLCCIVRISMFFINDRFIRIMKNKFTGIKLQQRQQYDTAKKQCRRPGESIGGIRRVKCNIAAVYRAL